MRTTPPALAQVQLLVTWAAFAPPGDVLASYGSCRELDRSGVFSGALLPKRY
jgi:hypothetical protein